MKVIYWAKPVPSRQVDWEAIPDDYEPGDPIGYGATREAAIAALNEQLAEIAADQPPEGY